MTNLGFAEYIWLDGNEPTQEIRSKTRVVGLVSNPTLSDFPLWSFDGSSTGQAPGDDSDCILVPSLFVRDPSRGSSSYLVLCEVQTAEGEPHPSNQRAMLRQILDQAGSDADPWAGFEQEYTIFYEGRPLGFPANGFPAPQGQYYCGVGSDVAFGRDLVEAHAKLCLEAGLMIYGTNAEVMPGQWEFQIGYRGIEDEKADALTMADHVWLARFLLKREAENRGLQISFANKPVLGDWNGAGMHTNFSTSATRSPSTGGKAIELAIQELSKHHDEHIPNYGEGLEKRLTGLHETCAIGEFRAGVGHRGASIRIPQPVAQKGFGYFEDRRPGANADPYRVAACLISTVCLSDAQVTQASLSVSAAE